jgi:hypothetical protein
MVIQRVITMSDDTFAQSGQAGAPPGDAEYNAVFAAVTATERGRWFLAEFANRTRKADTDVILAAIARVEAAIRSGATPQAALQREVLAVAAAIEPAPAREDERDEPAIEQVPANIAASDLAPAEIVQDSGEQDSGEHDSGEHGRSEDDSDEDAQALSDQDYSDAVAAIAASLTTRLEQSGKNLVRETAVEEPVPAREPAPLGLATAAETAMPAVGAMRQGRVPQDNSPRWHIESPDFVFGAADPDEAMPGTEPQPAPAQMQSQLLGAEIMSAEAWEAEVRAQPASQGDAPPAAGEEPSQLETAMDVRPAPVATEEAAPFPSAAASSPELELDVVPFTDTARPQLRVAREAIPSQRAPRYGSLTVTDALSEDEVIALFG